MPLIRPERPRLRDLSPVTIGIAVVLVAGLVATVGVLRSASGHGTHSAVAATTTTARSAPGATDASAPSKHKKAIGPTTTTRTASTDASPAASASVPKAPAVDAEHRTSLAAKRASASSELRRVTRDLALVLRAERALKAAIKLQPSTVVDAAIKQLDVRAAALRKQQADLRATLRALRPTTPAKPKTPARHPDKDKAKAKGRDQDTAGVRLPMTLTAAHKPQAPAAGSHARVGTATKVRSKVKAPTTTVQRKPTTTNTGKRVLVCPLSAGAGSSGGIGQCPPPLIGRCGSVPLPWHVWPCPPPRPSCAPWWWQCHRPRCGPLPKGGATGFATRLWPWCWLPVPPSPCGGPLKAPASGATTSIVCIGPLGGSRGGRLSHHTWGGTLNGSGSGTVSGTWTLPQAQVVRPLTVMTP